MVSSPQHGNVNEENADLKLLDDSPVEKLHEVIVFMTIRIGRNHSKNACSKWENHPNHWGNHPILIW